jgi:tRNA uracil 4-sulfurtransferase
VNVLVHYHEIALKGGNRPFFVEKLAENLRRATADLGGKVQVLGGRLLLRAAEPVAWEPLRARVGSVFGVANFGRTQQVPPDLDALKAALVADLGERRFASFRVTTKRSDKRFPMTSVEIDRAVGGAIHLATGVRVSLEEPELNVMVEVLRDRIFYSVERLPGPGGLAVGSSGRVAALLSGGIDSPVAAWRLMKRGCTVALVHFHAFPLQDHTTIDKARALARILTRYQFRTRLVLVPFGTVQQTIVAQTPAPLRVLLYRRFMLRIAEAIAPRVKAKALVTGDSLGQVASQTLDNLKVIDEAARGPVLRPLIGMDKDEITRQARAIGTFEISTLQDQDCCQLFVPKSPATSARIEEARAAEQALDVSGLVMSAVREATEERFVFPEAALVPLSPARGRGLR